MRRLHERKKREAPSVALYDAERITPSEAALLAARAEGCSCNPDITIEGASAFLRHDNHCALLRKRDVN